MGNLYLLALYWGMFIDTDNIYSGWWFKYSSIILKTCLKGWNVAKPWNSTNQLYF